MISEDSCPPPSPILNWLSTNSRRRLCNLHQACMWPTPGGAGGHRGRRAPAEAGPPRTGSPLPMVLQRDRWPFKVGQNSGPTDTVGGVDTVHPSVLTSADPLGGRQAVQGPLARDAIEGVLPSRLIRSSGSNHQGAHCVGEQHFAGLGECCDPSRNMYRDADDVRWL